MLKEKESHKNEMTNAHLCSESRVNNSEVPWEFVAELAFPQGLIENHLFLRDCHPIHMMHYR